MWTVPERVKHNQSELERVLEERTSTWGFLLINYREAIEDYLTTWANDIGWDRVNKRLKDPSSGLSQKIRKLIKTVDKEARADGVHWLDLDRIQRLEYTSRALDKI